MKTFLPRWPRRAAISALAALLGGCASWSLDSARNSFFSGDVEKAESSLADVKIPDKDRVLFLMERGMIRQSAGAYAESSTDFIEAADVIEALETYSLSKGGASWVVNDIVLNYRGAHYERTLLHAFTALNHFGLGLWNDAAVEARRITVSLDPEVRGSYPDDAFSRYVAGFCFERIDDASNAELQYRKAAELAPHLAIDPFTGRIRLSAPAETNSPPPKGQAELVCFVGTGRSRSADDSPYLDTGIGGAGYAEISVDGRLLGRSYPLTDTLELALLTRQADALRQAAKTIGRVIVKEGIASGVEHETQSDAMGELVRLVLIGLLERPDLRRWETLPRWLQVARVSCPDPLTGYDVEFKNAHGVTLHTMRIDQPIQRHRKTYVSFCKDYPVPRAR